jgi:uncharacterized protein (TIGR00730 family)
MPSPVITIFGSATICPEDVEYGKALEFGKCLGDNGFSVCSGGYGGSMEAVSRGAREAGARTIGITLKTAKSKANPWIQKEIKAATWQQRLFRLIEKGDAYVVFDGGTGTLVELFTVWEMMNKLKMKKPMIILGEFSRTLMGFLKKNPLMIFNPLIECVSTPQEAVAALVRWKSA